jgi:hypothetical protein
MPDSPWLLVDFFRDLVDERLTANAVSSTRAGFVTWYSIAGGGHFESPWCSRGGWQLLAVVVRFSKTSQPRCVCWVQVLRSIVRLGMNGRVAKGHCSKVFAEIMLDRNCTSEPLTIH